MDMPDSIFKVRRIWRNLRYRQTGPDTYMPVAEFCADRDLPFQVVESEHWLERVMPTEIDDGFYWRFADEAMRMSPATYYAELPEMYLTRNGFVFSRDRVLLADVSNEIGHSPDSHSLLRGGESTGTAETAGPGGGFGCQSWR